jgi:peptidoglycan hydrolase-like protein with peptidoglycan-binding domain
VPAPNPAPTPAPKPLPPVFQFKKNLVQNSRGNDVVQLQVRLQKLGFFPLKTKANGIMGPTTVASLKKLQAKYKIKENGLGAKTRALLNSLN